VTTPADQATDELRLTIADILDVDPERLTDDASFTEDLGVDSVLALEVAVTLERRHDVRITEDEIKGLTNLGDVRRLLAGKTR
jgi:acyl carrier protein